MPKLWKAICLFTVLASPPAFISLVMIMFDNLWVIRSAFAVVVVAVAYLNFNKTNTNSTTYSGAGKRHNPTVAALGFVIFSLALAANDQFHTTFEDTLSVQAISILFALIMYATFTSFFIGRIVAKTNGNERSRSSTVSD